MWNYFPIQSLGRKLDCGIVSEEFRGLKVKDVMVKLFRLYRYDSHFCNIFKTNLIFFNRSWDKIRPKYNQNFVVFIFNTIHGTVQLSDILTRYGVSRCAKIAIFIYLTMIIAAIRCSFKYFNSLVVSLFFFRTKISLAQTNKSEFLTRYWS